MSSNDLEKITEIIRDVFDDYRGPVTASLSARDVVQWDSLGNVQFVVMVERAFDVRFRSDEVDKFQSLGDLLSAIAQKRTAKR